MHIPTDKHALVTGATSGIGKATAIALAKAGVNVTLLGRSTTKLESVAEEIAALGVQVQSCVADLSQVSQVKLKVTEALKASQPLDILINNAGMGYTGSLSEMSLADWQHLLDLNLTSVLQCIQGVLPSMRQQKKGLIINVASVAAHQVFPDWGAYCISKTALLTLSKAIALEERQHGIRVATISPGAVNTPIWDTDTVNADFDRAQMLTPETVAQAIVQMALMPDTAVIEALTLMPSAGAL